MKVIFLDIDGVLNSHRYDLLRDWKQITFIDETRLPLLNRIVCATGAVIVLSTTWRTEWSKNAEELTESGRYIVGEFARYGIEIYDKTPDLGISADRADEIRAWLSERADVEKFVIIDDYRYDWREMSDNVVKTDMYAGRGLEDCHVRNAIEILGGAYEYADVIGRRVRVVTDRKLGATHPDYKDRVYEVNYGYIPGVTGGDGEEQDAYILGVNEPVNAFDGIVAAVIHRLDDNEDKWVVVPEGITVDNIEIENKTRFIERYFKSKIFR